MLHIHVWIIFYDRTNLYSTLFLIFSNFATFSSFQKFSKFLIVPSNLITAHDYYSFRFKLIKFKVVAFIVIL
jgi:hypothetical protein